MTTTRPTPSKILGNDGKPMSMLYPSPRRDSRAYKPRQTLRPNTRQNVTECDRAELVNYSRQLRAQIDVLASAVEQKNCWAFGDSWDAHYLGFNRAWGEEAESFLSNQFFPLCNLRGPQFDMRRSMLLTGQALDVDGDDLMILTESEGGFPQIAFFPGTRIGTGRHMGRATRDGISTVKGGPFDGARIHDGVIFDRHNRCIGVRILSEDGETHTDVSSYNADLIYEPSWHDQGRGIPRIATSLLRWMNLQDIDDYIQRGVKRASAVGLIAKTEDGEAVGNEVITGEDIVTGADGAPVTREIHYEEIRGGEMYYLSASGEETLTALDYKNPHPNTEAFIERMQRGALSSVGWFYEMMNLGETGRAPSRLLCDLANQTIWDRQATVLRRWKRCVNYALALAMKRGYLSRNDGGMDPYMWEPGLPKQITVDAGNEENADRENLKLGTTSKSIIAQKKGYHRKMISKQRMEEIEELCDQAKALSSRFIEVPFDRAIELLEQRSPNPPLQQFAAQAAAEAGEEEPRSKPKQPTQ